MKRRTVLGLPLLGFLSVPALANTENLSLNAQTQSVFRKLATVFKSPATAAVIGDEYLKSDISLRDPELLLANMGVSKNTVKENSLSLFEKQRASDYELGNTVTLDGWVFSKAEVSLCCAASLLLTTS